MHYKFRGVQVNFSSMRLHMLNYEDVAGQVASPDRLRNRWCACRLNALFSRVAPQYHSHSGTIMANDSCSTDYRSDLNVGRRNGGQYGRVQNDKNGMNKTR